MGRLDEAMPHLDKAVELLPEDAEAHSNLGLALAMKGQLDAAIPHLEKAVEINPAAFEGHFNLGRILAAQGKFEQAIPHFEEAVNCRAAGEAIILSLLAGVYGEVGRFAEAAPRAPRVGVTPRRAIRSSLEALKTRIVQYEDRGTLHPPL